MPKIKILTGYVVGFFLLATSLTANLTPTGMAAGVAKGVATSILIVTGEVKAGHIISHKNSNYAPATEPFDNDILGVIVESSSLALVDTGNPDAKLIMQKGEAQILASSSAGDIKKGDYITSSETPGVGQKADKNGFVVGRALEDLTVNPETNTGLVWSAIEPKYTYVNNTMKTNLLDALRSGSLSPLLNPVESLRYILAALIVAATFIIGFSTFGKSSGRTIEALGRNPLAQKSIKTAMVFNMILAFGVMLIGLALAYLILVL